jgi:hypothetical protein
LASPRKIEKLGARIVWLLQREMFGLSDSRRQERIEPVDGHTILITSDGDKHLATLIDISSQGAAMNVEIAPPVGTPVTVCQRRARVVRHFPGGIAVTFQKSLRLPQRSCDLMHGDVVATSQQIAVGLP